MCVGWMGMCRSGCTGHNMSQDSRCMFANCNTVIKKWESIGINMVHGETW